MKAVPEVGSVAAQSSSRDHREAAEPGAELEHGQPVDGLLDRVEYRLPFRELSDSRPAAGPGTKDVEGAGADYVQLFAAVEEALKQLTRQLELELSASQGSDQLLA
jgi:hypothetical protein